MGKYVYKEEQIKLIMECHRSGLSDYRWCEQNEIHPGNFYNWVSKLKKKGYTFPEPASKTKAVPDIQDVVKVDIIESDDSEPSIMEQNTGILAATDSVCVAAELLIGNITLRIYNGAHKHLIRNTFRCIEGKIMLGGIPLAQLVLRIITGMSDLIIASCETHADMKRVTRARYHSSVMDVENIYTGHMRDNVCEEGKA